MFFDRSANLFGNNYTQTLEPRVYYLYAAFDDQRDIPIFDTSRNTFSFAQLFRDQRFSGGDLRGDAHQVTLALTSRQSLRRDRRNRAGSPSGTRRRRRRSRGR